MGRLRRGLDRRRRPRSRDRAPHVRRDDRARRERLQRAVLGVPHRVRLLARRSLAGLRRPRRRRALRDEEGQDPRAPDDQARERQRRGDRLLTRRLARLPGDSRTSDLPRRRVGKEEGRARGPRAQGPQRGEARDDRHPSPRAGAVDPCARALVRRDDARARPGGRDDPDRRRREARGPLPPRRPRPGDRRARAGARRERASLELGGRDDPFLGPECADGEAGGAGHTQGILCVAFSSDGKRLVTGSGDHTARIWNLETGEETARLRHLSTLRAIACSAEEPLVATCDGAHLRQFDLETGAEHGDGAVAPRDVRALAFPRGGATPADSRVRLRHWFVLDRPGVEDGGHARERDRARGARRAVLRGGRVLPRRRARRRLHEGARARAPLGRGRAPRPHD